MIKPFITFIAILSLSTCAGQDNQTASQQSSYRTGSSYIAPTPVRFYYLNVNNASRYFQVYINLNGNGMGLGTNFLSASASVGFDRFNLSEVNTAHANTTNITFSGAVTFEYSYFKNNSFLSGSKQVSFSGTLFKGQSYNNTSLISTSISEIGASQINGISRVRVNINSMNGTLVLR